MDYVKNQSHHSRMKHLRIHHTFESDLAQNREVEIERILGIDNIADIMTKPLGQPLSKHALGLGFGQTLLDKTSKHASNLVATQEQFKITS